MSKKYRIVEHKLFSGLSHFYPEKKCWFLWRRFRNIHDISVRFDFLEEAQEFIQKRKFYEKKITEIHKVEETNE